MKVVTTILAIALGLWLCSAASAMPQDVHSPQQATGAPSNTHQDLRNPDQVAPARGHLEDLRNPDQVVPESPSVLGTALAPAPEVVATDVVPASGGGLSTLLIVLISVGGAAALAGAGYATMRLTHGHGHAPA